MKPKKKMTNDEYRAAAMLLGYTYLTEFHLYVVTIDNEKPISLATPSNYLDPDTLNKIPYPEWTQRRGRFRGG